MEDSNLARPAKGNRPTLAADLAMVALALFSIWIIFYDEVYRPGGRLRLYLVVADAAIVAVFLAEFGARFWRAPNRREFVKRYWWELPGMVPMAVGDASFLRVFRLIRVFAVLSRLVRARRLAGGFLARSNLLMTISATIGIVFIAAFLEFMFERDANPDQFRTYGDALWWAVVTAATVGYGDIFPQTLGGRFVATGLMFSGIGLIGVLAATISSALIGSNAPAPKTLEERLKSLADLHASGQISDEEFRAAKARLLQES